MLQPYRELAAVPRVPGLLTWSMLGRLHLTGTPLAMSFLIAGWTGSYGLAGVVSAALMAGFAVAGPLRGRAADRRGATGLLVATGVFYGVGLTVLAFLPSWLPAGWWPLLGLLAFVVGLGVPPVIPVSRATWPRVLSGSALNSIYTVEATLTELLYAVGPLVVAAAVAVISPAIAMVICGAFATVGACAFAWSLVRAGQDRPIKSDDTPHGNTWELLRRRGVLPSLGLAFCLVAALLTVDMTIVAWARNVDMPIMAGILGGVWAAGSGIGGLVAGGLTGQPRLTFRVLLNLVGLIALVPVLPPIFDPASPWLIGLVLLLGGAAIAPAIATANARLGELTPPRRRAEAYGWLTTASTTGFAVSLPLTGLLLDHGGESVAATSAVVFALLGLMLAMRIPVPKPVVEPVPAAS